MPQNAVFSASGSAGFILSRLLAGVVSVKVSSAQACIEGFRGSFCFEENL